MWRRKTSSLEEQPHIVRLSAQPRGFRRKGWHHLRHLLAPLALTLCGSATLTQDRPTATTPVNSEQFISETHNRVVFDKEAFSFGPVPYWSEGYLISIKTESFSPGTINARLFGRGGSKSAEVAFWFPGPRESVLHLLRSLLTGALWDRVKPIKPTVPAPASLP